MRLSGRRCALYLSSFAGGFATTRSPLLASFGTLSRSVLTVICLTPLPGVATLSLWSVTPHCRHRCDETELKIARPTHLALSCTLAQPVSSPNAAGRLLPYRFTQHPLVGRFTFCCGCSQQHFSVPCPHLLFREATLPWLPRAESREVPLSS
jgi:hypothetical protein